MLKFAVIALCAFTSVATATEPVRPHPRVAMCIVGQVARMEVFTKARNIVAANLHDGIEMDVVGYLTAGQPHYTNTLLLGSTQDEYAYSPTCYTGNLSASTVATVFQESFLRLGAKNVRAFIEPGKPDSYWGDLPNRLQAGPLKTYSFAGVGTTARLYNQLRQW